MSLLPTETIQLMGEFAGIASLKEEVVTALAQDVEYRLREIIQESIKFMRHAKRTKLTPADINYALRARNALYGFQSTSTPLHFKHVPQQGGSVSLFYVEDEELDFEDIVNAPLPSLPAEISFTSHWLAVEGVQPAIPQNPAPLENRIEALTRKIRASESRSDLFEKKIDIKPLVKHILSKELQLYYEKIVLACLHANPELRDAALESVREDNGIQQLLPYFIQFVTDQIAKNMKHLGVLQAMLLFMGALLDNTHFFMEPYLHQLMPPLLSCLVAKRLGDPSKPSMNPQNHWSIREMAARLLAHVCSTYGPTYETLQPRVTRTLLRAFLDTDKPFTTHYGAIVGLSTLGVEMIKVVLIPNMQLYLDLMAKRVEEGKPEVEAEKCREALRDAAVLYLKEAIHSGVKENENENAMEVDSGMDLSQIEHGPLLEQLFGRNVLVERLQ